MGLMSTAVGGAEYMKYKCYRLTVSDLKGYLNFFHTLIAL